MKLSILAKVPVKTSISAVTMALCLGAPPLRAADIEFWYGNTGRIETAIQAGCDAFNASQDQHRVTCVGQGGYETGMQKAIAAYRSDQHPVLIQFFDAGTLDLMVSGAVVPVFEAMPGVDWSGYVNGARSYYETSKGALFSQPYNGSTLVFYANKAALAEAGVAALPTTYEELIAAATKLRDAGHACPYATDGHPWRVLEQFAARHGVPVATNNNGYGGLDADYIFNAGLTAEHLHNLAKWRRDGLVRINQDTVAGHYHKAFNAGECAMIVASTGGYAGSLAALGDDLAMTMAPMYEGYARKNTLIGGASIWLMKGHEPEDVDAARAYLDFLRREDTQIAFTRATGYMPVTQAALDKLVATGMIDEQAFAAAEVGVASLNQPSSDDSRGIRLGFYVQFRDIFKEETQKAFNGDQTMQAALDRAAARGDELLRRFEQTYEGVELP